MVAHRTNRTSGRRLTDLSAAQGLAAETSAAATVGAALAGLDVPISTSHTLASSVVGAGLAQGPRHVRWPVARSEEHTSELQSRGHLVCRLLLEKKKT